jgi:pimeloyl-ACP methyl ester carboxylesterase
VPDVSPFPRARRSLVLTAALAAVLTGCTATISGHGVAGSALNPPGSSSPAPGSSAPATPSSPSAPTVGPSDFTDCTALLNLGGITFPAGRKAKLSFGCAKVTVPLDYSDPNGQSIQLQMIKVHDSDDKSPIGSLVVNPGGPGGSGLDLAVGLATEVSTKLLDHFDLLGFDPRGVGLSSPLSCTSDAQKDIINAASPQILTTAGFTAAKAQAAATAGTCSAKYGSSLADYNTVNTARDMDLIRQAVGDSKLNYLGFSYGTELGAQYAHLFPDNIRVFVLDGAVDPLTDSITSFADQLKGFEQAFDQFAANCKTKSPCSSLGNPRQVVYDINAKAITAPLSTGTSRPLTSNLALTGVLEALYSQSDWPTLGAALIQAKAGNGSGLLKLADQYNQRLAGGQYTNISDANLTIGCNDSPTGPLDATIRATAKAWATQFPMFGLWAAPSLFACQQWQPTRTVPPKPTAPTDTKVLVIGNLHDPATPYQGALDLAKTMGNAEVLTWNGEGHTSYLQGSTCIDNAVDTYLINGTLPPANTTCPR